MTPPLTAYLRDELARRGWSIEEFAKKANLSPSNAYLIIRDGKDNVRRGTLRSIAGALGMTPSELEAALEAQSSDDPIKRAILERTALMREITDGVPAPFRSTIINKIFDRAIDGAKDLAQLLGEQTTVTAHDGPVVTRPDDSGNRVDFGPETELSNRKRGQAAGWGFPSVRTVTPIAVAP